jgi:hypothetical protein
MMRKRKKTIRRTRRSVTDEDRKKHEIRENMREREKAED